MSANIFIIFPVEVQCWSMAQRVVHSLSGFGLASFFFPHSIFKTFQAKIFTVSKFTAEEFIMDWEGQKVGGKQS